jgi:hypothetical protein
MTLRVRAASIAPDLRFGAASALADPLVTLVIGNVIIHAEGCLPQSSTTPRYLRYADRDAVVVADGIDDFGELELCLGDQVQVIAESDVLDDLSTAVVVLDAIDYCFRETGLWRGNIYLAGTESLTVVLDLVGARESGHRASEVVSRELAALELAYLFPVARKFRSGSFDGQVQYRLNGWGRALALRLAGTRLGAARASVYRLAISDAIAGERERYELFLAQLDVARQHYSDNRLGLALSLPIPILV